MSFVLVVRAHEVLCVFQYFYLGETVLMEVPKAANFVVGTFVIVEMATDGTEGLVYGMLTTVNPYHDYIR